MNSSNKKMKHFSKVIEIPPGTDLNLNGKAKDLEEGIKSLANVRFNLITRCPEIELKGRWVRIDDYKLNSLVRALKRSGVKGVSRTSVGELLESDFSRQVHPIKDYFESLPNVSEDYIQQMVNTIELASSSSGQVQKKEMFKLLFTKWLVGAVANVFIEDRCANHLCLILAGNQGSFKTSWIANLCPASLSDYYIEGAVDPDNKDSMIATATNFIYNLDDYFASVTSRKINEFKGLLTKSKIKVRRAYARYPEELPKICSFIGSSNEAQFLHDPTGSRRFLPFEIQKINIEEAKKVNIDMLWAQAYHLFRDGFIYWIEKEDQENLVKYNERFEVQSNELELLLLYVYPPEPGETPDAALTNAQILTYLQNKTSIKLSTKKLGEALRKAQFTRKQIRRNNSRAWVYEVNYAEEADVYAASQPYNSNEENDDIGF